MSSGPTYSAAHAATLEVAFLGLGAMGSRMAARLLENGAKLTVYNRSAAPTRALARRGAKVAETPRDAVANAPYVVTMVSDARALDALARGRDGVLKGLERGAVWIEMSTCGRPAARRLAARARSRGAHFVDAPVSGTVGPAERGELVAFVGGSAAARRRAEPVLRVLCKRLIVAGGVGQGQALKVIVNGLGAHHLVAFASMLRLGERAGLSREVILDAFTQGAFASPSYVGKKARVLARDYGQPEFTLDLTLKDVSLAAAMSRELGAKLPVLSAVQNEVRKGVAAGLGPKDLFGLERLYRTKAW